MVPGGQVEVGVVWKGVDYLSKFLLCDVRRQPSDDDLVLMKFLLHALRDFSSRCGHCLPDPLDG